MTNDRWSPVQIPGFHNQAELILLSETGLDKQLWPQEGSNVTDEWGKQVRKRIHDSILYEIKGER